MRRTIPAIILSILATITVSHSLRAQQTRSVAPPAADVKRLLAAYTDALEGLLPSRVRPVLRRIPSSRRRLLAMKYYLRRTPGEIEEKWAWNAGEIRLYRRSKEYGQAAAELDKVTRKFAELNPGYRLEVRMEIRTLGEQVRKWNGVRSIGGAGNELADTCLALMADSAGFFASEPTPERLTLFADFLRVFEPQTVPTVAVPGLSQHGQLRAFDFSIRRGGAVVAGPSTRSIPSDWDGAGWTVKLGDAICSVSDRFQGPLYDPYEPWHYTYIR